MEKVQEIEDIREIRKIHLVSLIEDKVSFDGDLNIGHEHYSNGYAIFEYNGKLYFGNISIDKIEDATLETSNEGCACIGDVYAETIRLNETSLGIIEKLDLSYFCIDSLYELELDGQLLHLTENRDKRSVLKGHNSVMDVKFSDGSVQTLKKESFPQEPISYVSLSKEGDRIFCNIAEKSYDVMEMLKECDYDKSAVIRFDYFFDGLGWNLKNGELQESELSEIKSKFISFKEGKKAELISKITALLGNRDQEKE